jgi:hypothetical protein
MKKMVAQLLGLGVVVVVQDITAVQAAQDILAVAEVALRGLTQSAQAAQVAQVRLFYVASVQVQNTLC